MQNQDAGAITRLLTDTKKQGAGAITRFLTTTKKPGSIGNLVLVVVTKAGDGNRTHVSSLEGWCSTIELHPHDSGSNAVGI